MSKYLQLLRRGDFGAPEGSEQFDVVSVPPHSRLEFNSQGAGIAAPYWTARTVFDNLPAAAAAAGNDNLLLSLGTGTEVIARAAKGGTNVKTQASTPADNDNAMLIPVASSSMFVPLTAVTQPRFKARVRLSQITELVFGAGLDQNITSPILAATANEGASFYFDPASELAVANAANWNLALKVAGVVTYVDSGIQVLTGVDYELMIVYGADLKAQYFINGTKVGTAATANSQVTLGAVVGVQINAGSPAGQKDFDARFVTVERFVG